MKALSILMVTKKVIVKPLCTILPQIGGCIKYFENGSKTCLF